MSNIKDDEAEKMRLRARAADQKWRAANGLPTKGLPEKPKPKRRWRRLERKEVERMQQRGERRALRVPMLKGVE
ncbi:MAG: hypothetical protein C0480_01175 [Bradyrhizobium sp.]|nr:hypothetical protein [Bradyrhizobium sp.]